METKQGSDRQLLRHTVATLAYRAEKVLRDTPEVFANYHVSESTRTPVEILAHIGDLLDWALFLAKGDHKWQNSEPLPWDQEITRFFTAIESFDACLASDEPLAVEAERLFQGPIADALTHVGQIAMMRRMAGAPVRGENFFKAEIMAGRSGRRQAKAQVEFD